MSIPYKYQLKKYHRMDLLKEILQQQCYSNSWDNHNRVSTILMSYFTNLMTPGYEKSSIKNDTESSYAESWDAMKVQA